KGGKAEGEKASPQPSTAVTLSRSVNPSQYVLGPGDQLTISLWGEYNSIEGLSISAEGKISLETIGELKLAGLTLEQAEALLKVSVSKFYRNVQSGISLSTLRTFKVSVLGAVNSPGTYTASLDTRVSEVIALAGGVLPGGSIRHIQVRKGSQVRTTCDLNAFLRQGSEAANPYLQDGETIFVPPVKGPLVRVFDLAAASPDRGKEDTSPPALPIEYELEHNSTLATLVTDLGGLNPGWDLDNTYVIRSPPSSTETQKIRVDMRGLMIHQDRNKDVPLQNGDQVYFGTQLRSPYLNGKGELVGIEKPYR
ncbi:MAG: polysaccharide biosynthesis/export family protein, partial [Candidatus Eremiobacterota bacterium]